MNDKTGILSRLHLIPDAALELGCGSHKRHPEAIGIDQLDFPEVDLVGDVFEILTHIPAQTISHVYAYHFFEHIEDPTRLLQMLARVMKPGGRLVVVVPHFSNPYYYSDPTHRTSFGLYTFSYLAQEDLFTRKVPPYGSNFMFRLQKVTLNFKSPRPFYFRWAWKQLFHILFNLNNYTREFYEENLCYIVPCYELRFELQRLDGQEPLHVEESLVSPS